MTSIAPVADAESPATAGSRRRLHLEVLRVLAIVLVVFNHTGTRGFFLFSVTDNPVTQPIYLFLSIACKIAVPLFFMISGALLIPKDESIGTLYRKRILRIAVALVVFSYVAYVYKNGWSPTEFDPIWFIKKVYSTSSFATAYWFLYSYLAILMMLPFVRRMARRMTDAEYAYLVVLQLVVVGVLPLAEYLGGFDRLNLQLPLVTTSLFYFVMGYYFEHRLDGKYLERRYMIPAVGLGIGGVVLAGVMTMVRAHATGVLSEADSQMFFSSFIAPLTFSVFCLARSWSRTAIVPDWARWVVVRLGEAVFGVFLLEGILRKQLEWVFVALLPYIRTLPATMVWVISVVLVGILAVSLLRRVPLVGRLL